MYTVTLYEIRQVNLWNINGFYPVVSKPLRSNIVSHFRQFSNFLIFHLVGYVQNTYFRLIISDVSLIHISQNEEINQIFF
jgi:hypothetical protein